MEREKNESSTHEGHFAMRWKIKSSVRWMLALLTFIPVLIQFILWLCGA